VTTDLVEPGKRSTEESRRTPGADPHGLVEAQGPTPISISRPTVPTLPVSPGLRAVSARERDILGVGVETVGTDAGRRPPSIPCFPAIPSCTDRIVRSGEPHQSRIPPSHRCCGDRAAAENRQRFGKSAARACTRTRVDACKPRRMHLRSPAARRPPQGFDPRAAGDDRAGRGDRHRPVHGQRRRNRLRRPGVIVSYAIAAIARWPWFSACRRWR